MNTVLFFLCSTEAGHDNTKPVKSNQTPPDQITTELNQYYLKTVNKNLYLSSTVQLFHASGPASVNVMDERKPSLFSCVIQGSVAGFSELLDELRGYGIECEIWHFPTLGCCSSG